jgi:uncharacterized membrane protein
MRDQGTTSPMVPQHPIKNSDELGDAPRPPSWGGKAIATGALSVGSSQPARAPAVVTQTWLPLGVLVFLVGAYTVALSELSIQERAVRYQFDEDLAIYDQIVWNTAHGHPFASTLIQHANNMLGDHFSPIVAIFTPIYWVWPDARVLLIGQSLALGLVAVPLFLAARPTLGGVGALLVGAAYLVYPAIHFVNLFQFHEIALLPLPLSFALLAVERGWRWRFLAAALVSLLVKEEVAIVVFGLAFLWWLRRRDWRMLVATVALSVVVGTLTLGIILPRLSLAGAEYYYVRRYAYLGRNPLEMAITALTSPGLLLGRLTTTDRLAFLVKLFLPLALIPLLGWEYVVAGLPVFGYLLLADSPDQYAIDRHYLAPLLPFLFFGLAVGIARITSPLSTRWRGVRGEVPRISLTALVLLVSAAASYVLGPTPLGRGYDPQAFSFTDHTSQTGEAIAAVPSGESVSATRNLLSWFSERERVYRFPETSNADYVVFDPRQLRYPAVYGGDDGPALTQLLASPAYRLIASAGAVLVFQRAGATGWDVPPSQITRFGESIELGKAEARLLPDRSGAEVTFDWRALARLTTQYTIFVHVYDPSGKLLGQTDRWPLDNLYPTDLWLPGRIIPDTHLVTFHEPLAPTASLRVEAGLYELKSGARLPITARGLGGGTDFVEFWLSPP